MKPDLKTALESLHAAIALSVPAEGDYLHAPLDYLLGDFKMANLPHYKTLQDIIDAMNPHAEISIGIGFETYKASIYDGINNAIATGGRFSFMLPLWDERNTHSFFLALSCKDGYLNMLIYYFGNALRLLGIDQLLANSFKDQLTGLFNARTMKRHVAENRKGSYLCLFDLNKFKDINDTFGHKIGDDVLTLTASFLISISSSNEVFYRRSGDEFMILFLRDDLAYAKSVIAKIEAYLEELSENALKHCPGLTCSASYGLLELQYPGGKDVIGLENQLKLTDLAMYQAKKAHKRMHIISFEDAQSILEKGDLDLRLAKLARSISR